MHRRHTSLLAFALFLLVMPLVAFAQGTNVIVLGTVRDTTGTIITGAEVKIEGAGATFTRSVVTGTDGQYQVTDVPPGTYKVIVTATNYRPAVATITVTADAKQIFDLGVEVNATQPTLTVDTDAEVTQKEDSILGSVTDTRRVAELPLNVRVPYNFVLLQPGAVHAPANYSLRQSHYSIGSALQDQRALPFTFGGLRDVPAVNGNRPMSGNYKLDGIDNNNQSVAGFNTNVSPDAVQELRVATHNYSAEYGRNSGFIANITTKSGDTEFHGSAFEFLNNDVLNANSFFAGLVQPGTQLFDEDNKDRIRRNQFGGTVGGPIISNKALFFASGEWHRERSSLINTLTAPTGVFGGTLNPLVPQSILLGLFPAPTPGFGFFDGNFDSVADSGIGAAAIYRSINRNMFSFRVDLVPTNSDRVTLRYANDDYDEDSLQGQLPGAGFGYQGFNTKIESRGQNAFLQWVHTFSPRVYNDFTIGYNRFSVRASQPIAADIPLVLVQPNVIVRESRQVDLSVPELEDLFTGVSLPSLRSDLPLNQVENTYQFRNIISVTAGDHHFKVGGEYRRLLMPSQHDAFINGKFTFLGTSGGVNSFGVGNPLYTQFLVDPFTGGAPNTYRSFRRHEGNLFIQDDYKVTRNLTINLGLRYEYFGVLSAGRPAGVGLANFFFGGAGNDFFGNVATGNVFDISQTGDRLYGRDNNNFAPRIGFAYDFGGNAKSVIRGSYGIFYDRVITRLIENVRFNPPFASIGFFTGGPINTLNTPLDRTEVLLSDFRPNLYAVDQNLKTPYVQQWFLGFQKDIGGNTMLEINYVGNTGRGLVVTSDVNRFNGSAVFGRPNPNFARIFLTETTAKSFYNALQLSVNRRFSNGFQANFSYTYSHSIDEASDPFLGVNGMNVFPSEAYTGPMEVRNFRLDRGSSDFDVRHRAIFNLLYELPFLRGSALGGWQINTVTTLQSGQPFTVFSANDANGDLIFNDRAVYFADEVEDGIVDDPKESGLQYLNPALFVQGFGPASVSGAMGRNLFTGPRFFTVDLSVLKNTKIGEDVNLQFRAEFFNLFNRVNFMNPSGNLSNPATFNLLTKTYNPRMIQLGLRLQF